MGKTKGKQQGGMDGQRAGGAKRRRGARPGNTNALKHGFYSQRLTSRGISWLDDQPARADLLGEINLLRVFIRQMFTALEKHSPAQHKDKLKFAETYSQAVVSLFYAVRARRLPGQNGADPAAEFNAIIQRVVDGSNAAQE